MLEMSVNRRVRQFLDEVAFPIPLQALWHQSVEQGLDGRKWHDAHPIKQRRRKLAADRLHDRFGLLGGPIVRGDERANRRTPQLFRERIGRRHGLEAHERAEFEGRTADKVPVPLHDRARMLAMPHDRSGVDHADRMGLEHEARHHAEVSAAAAQRPKEVGVLRFARGDERAVRQHDIGLDQVVDREAVFSR